MHTGDGMAAVEPAIRFARPPPWAIGPGPSEIGSLDQALVAVHRWLDLMPPYPRFAAQRERMLTLREILHAARRDPTPADLASATLGIEGMVTFVQATEVADSRLRLVHSA